jgi:hypothetical protein
MGVMEQLLSATCNHVVFWSSRSPRQPGDDPIPDGGKQAVAGSRSGVRRTVGAAFD